MADKPLKGTMAPVASNNEREFLAEELFFSTTDVRGVIEFGNEVFTRIAAYTEEELIGAPHSIIRHPDMPRAVFYLLWDYLLNGKCISAYVKNLAKDGRYYWVYAFVSPVEGGFVSIRLKPTSAIFPVVRDLYKKLRQIELDAGDRGEARKAGMMSAVEELGVQLNKLGFANYDEFMNTALIEEMKARKKLLVSDDSDTQVVREEVSRHPLLMASRRLRLFLNEALVCIEQFLDLDKMLRQNAATILQLARSMQQLALNASIRTTHLGQEGATLSVVAHNLGTQSSNLSHVMQSLNGQMSSVLGVIRGVAHNTLASDLTLEMSHTFFTELVTNPDPTGSNSTLVHRNVSLLADVFEGNVKRALESVRASVQCLATLRADLNELTKLVKTLSFVHVTGKVEAARLRNGATFADLFEHIVKEIELAQGALQQIWAALDVVQAPVRELEGTMSYLKSFRETVALTFSDETAAKRHVGFDQEMPEQQAVCENSSLEQGMTEAESETGELAELTSTT